MKKYFKILFLSGSLVFAANSMATETTFGGNEAKVKIVSCYPNPATTQINFEIKYFEKGYTLNIYNFIGKKVEEINLSNFKNNINLENYFRGVYIFQLRDRKGNIVESGKFQVTK